MPDIIEDESQKDSRDSPSPAPKKPKRRSKLKYALFLLLLAAGVVTGMHNSGAIDVRPYIWSTAPKVPYVGEYLKEYLNVPETYTLTVEERRKLELAQWQERLDEKEKELQEQLAHSETLSGDLADREQKLKRQESDLLALESGLPIDSKKGETTPETEALMKDLTSTYGEISSSKAAKIVEALPSELAVDLLRRMPQDARASILGKMEPRKAAQITEELATPQ